MATRKPAFVALAAKAKAIAKARPGKRAVPLYEAFALFAAAGDVAHATALAARIDRAQLSTGFAAALDGFHGGAAHEAAMRARLTANAYGGEPPDDDRWEDKPMPWRAIDRWRRVQDLARQGLERDALARLSPIIDELGPADRGLGYGSELVLALDLALRHGEAARVPGWIAKLGHRFVREPILLTSALCLPAPATAIAGGLLREAVGLSPAELASAFAAIVAADEAPVVAKPVGALQKRRVAAEYSQVHLEHETLDAAERAQIHFQRRGDSERGMSLFPSRVGISTPVETDRVDAEITISAQPVAVDGVVQAVAFPFVVRGPLVLASVAGGDPEPFVVPPGAYDVLARFVAKRARGSLRVFTLLLSFHPPGSQQAPRTLVVE